MSHGDATLWTAVAAAGGAVASGALTGFVTYRVTRRQVTSSEREAKRQRDHEKAMADEERHQRRLFDAYTSVMRYALSWTQSIEWRLRATMVRLDPPAERPEPDVIDPTSTAVASLVASGDVAGLLRDFNAAVVDYQVKLGSFTQVEATAGIPPIPQLAQSFRDAYEALHAAGQYALGVGNQLIEKMRQELGARGELPG
jgi:hypothetical protein